MNIKKYFATTYHHSILPLLTPFEQEIEITWGIYKFIKQNKTNPIGIIFPEYAFNLNTLSIAAQKNISFSLISPAQIKKIRYVNELKWHPANKTNLYNIKSAYVKLPEEDIINLLVVPKYIWNNKKYHLNYKEDNFKNSNYEIKIYENTSIGCKYGLKCWKEECTCKSSNQNNFHQHWKKPLRRALNLVKYYIDESFFTLGKNYFIDPRQALLNYGKLILGLQSKDLFVKKYIYNQNLNTAFQLLEMERLCLNMFSSYIWQSRDISSSRVQQNLKLALMAIYTLERISGIYILNNFLEILEEAISNNHHIGDGRFLVEHYILPKLKKSSSI